MGENREWDDLEKSNKTSGSRWNAWLAVGLVAALVAAGLAFGYGYRQQAAVTDLTTHNAEMTSNVSQMQSQVEQLNAKLTELSNAQAAAAAEAQARSSPAGGQRRAADDRRLKQLQTQMQEQQKLLKDTQDSVAQAKSDLEGNLSSTRDELNGSIAKTHEELVELRQRGERDYFEFELSKAKQFQHAGPVMLSLRKADTKHKNFDLQMIVDDNELSKKRVNLYEPIWIHRTDDSQPIQVVVNRIDKNHIRGYVSAAKYKSSDSAAPATKSPGDVPLQDQNSTSSTPPIRRPID